MEVKEILSELENNTGKFPREALEIAIESKETITPFLLDVLSECKDNLEDLFNKSDYFLHIYALFLLAQFREPKAYPLIIDFFSVPGELPLEVTGDVVTEGLGKILASVSDGNIEPIKQLIEKQEVDQFTRSAAIRTLVILVVQEIIPLEEVIEYFEKLFLTVFATKDSKTDLEWEGEYVFWTELVINSSILCPEELKEYIERAFDEDLIEPFFFGRDEFNDNLQAGSEANLNELREDERYSLIKDTISEIGYWACFEENQPKNLNNNLTGIEGFSRSGKKTSKSKAKKKKKMQKESRRKNRQNKK